MVHFDRPPEVKIAAPVARSVHEIRAQRDADRAKIQEFKAAQAAIARGEVANVEEYYAKVDEERSRQQTAEDEADERLLQLIRGVNEKTAARAVESRAAAAAPASVEAAPVVAMEAAPEPEKTVEDGEKKVEHFSEAERVAYAKAMRDAALAKQKRMIDDHARLAQERARLRSLPSTPSPLPYLRSVERPKEEMPKIDPFQKINIPGFGEAQILFVDPDEDLMYFATPEERRRVDVALMRDESQSSRNVADYTRVIQLTPAEVRRILSEQPKAPPEVQPANSREANAPLNATQHLQGRYAG